MIVAIPIFDRLTALDAVGPYEVLSRLPGWTVQFVAAEPGPKRTDNSMLALVADRSLERIAGRDIAEAIQLGIEYDPDPPFPGGSVASARPEIVELVRSRADELT